MENIVKQIREIIETSDFPAEIIIADLSKQYRSDKLSKKRTKKRKVKICRPPIYISDSSTENDIN